MIDPKDVSVIVLVDRPTSGQHHNGPVSSWVQVMHKATGMSACAYHRTQFKAKEAAMFALEYLLSECYDGPASFPERVADAQSIPQRQRINTGAAGSS